MFLAVYLIYPVRIFKVVIFLFVKHLINKLNLTLLGIWSVSSTTVRLMKPNNYSAFVIQLVGICGWTGFLVCIYLR